MRSTRLKTGMSATLLAQRTWAILALFAGLTLIMLYPLSVSLLHMVPEPTDPLLNAWRMQWHSQALLQGPQGFANLFNTNIFYPFPLTLAYSEHFLMISWQALPFLLLADSHLLGMNLSVLATFILSGYAAYLLVTAWTGRRWAGLVAGVLFAFSPQRFGQLNHLELLVTQWLPLALLALHWTLTRPGWRYPALFILFFNLQALSGFHYTLNLTLACLLLALVYALAGRVYWRPGLWIAAALSILVTLLINWPIWRLYLRFSDVMGAVRTPGEVRIYSAALTDYLTAIPYNLLYGWTFGRWQSPGHQFQPLMPFGLVGLLLALVALVFWFTRPQSPISNPQPAGQVSQILNPQSPISNPKSPFLIFALLLVVLALLLSFGLNENALGESLASLLKRSPYFWLYHNVAIFQGIRVPARFGVLALLGLTVWVGWGAAALLEFVQNKLTSSGRAQLLRPALSISLIVLILLESWSAPLVGPTFPGGKALPPVYDWLRRQTPPETVVLELPFQGPSEFSYEYYSSYHWRRLANGGSGYTPPIYKELRGWFNHFPDPRSVDVMQQLGIDLVILHADSDQPGDWSRRLDDLPRYLPAVEQIWQVGDALVLRLAEPHCRPDPDRIQVSVSPTTLDGWPDSLAVSYHNPNPAAFVADVQQVSRLNLAGQSFKNFTEPLVTPAGETQTVVVPLKVGQSADLSGVWLATLSRSVAPEVDQPESKRETGETIQWRPLGLNFADGPQLAAYSVTPETPAACQILTVSLQWLGGQPGDTALLQLLDPFGRVVVESATLPWVAGNSSPEVDVHPLPLVGPLPAGRYGLRVRVYTAAGAERLPTAGADGGTIPPDQIPPLPLVIHPALPEQIAVDSTKPLAVFDESITLLGVAVKPEPLAPGDWLRFSLIWQVEQPVETELTVFTQLIGPDGQVWGQRDNRPGGGWYGFPLWLPHRPVVDEYAFRVEPGAPPGIYRLIVGLYQSDTLARLSSQSGADFVEVGSVVVTE